MPISFACPACSKKYSVKDGLAGKEATCTCGAKVSVPAAPVSATAGANDPLGLNALEGPLSVPPSPSSTDPLIDNGTAVPASEVNQPLGEWNAGLAGKTADGESPTLSPNKKVVIISSAISGGVGLLLGIIIMLVINGLSGSSSDTTMSGRNTANSNKTESASVASTPPKGDSRKNTSPPRAESGPLKALNGHWKKTHIYNHDDGDLRDGSMGRMAEDLTDAGILNPKRGGPGVGMYYDSAHKVFLQVDPDGTIQRGTFDVLPDRNHPGRFNMKVTYGDGDGYWSTDSYYLSNSNRQLDHQWIRPFGNGPNAERWVYVDAKIYPRFGN